MCAAYLALASETAKVIELLSANFAEYLGQASAAASPAGGKQSDPRKTCLSGMEIRLIELAA